MVTTVGLAILAFVFLFTTIQENEREKETLNFLSRLSHRRH